MLREQPKIKVMIVDDHELTRLSLKISLSMKKNLEIVGLASNGQEAIQKAETYEPDVIILDLQMPVLNGLSAASEIKRILPQTHIIAYTSVQDPQTEVMCETVPVDMLCQKDTPTDTLYEFINQLGKPLSSLLKVSQAELEV